MSELELLFVELPLLVPVSGTVPPVVLDPLLVPLGAVLLPLLSGVMLLFSGVELFRSFCCSVLELGLLGFIVALVWLLSTPELELYWSEKVPPWPWLCLEAQPAATKPASAIIASIFFIISPFKSFALTFCRGGNALNRAFTRFVAQ